MPVFIYIILLGLVNFYTTAGLAAQTASKADFNVITYQSSPEGFMSNSHIIIGENEAILIDAQFSQVEGKKVAELIKSTGKKTNKDTYHSPSSGSLLWS